MNDRGSAAVEAVTGAVLAAALISGGLGFTYTFLAHLWIQNSAYEASICLATSQSSYRCEQEFKHRVSRVLSLGSLARVQLQRSETAVQTKVSWLAPGGFHLKVDDKRTLPLAADNRRAR